MATSNPVQAGGGWPQAKGQAYFKLSEWWVISDTHFPESILIRRLASSPLAFMQSMVSPIV